MAFFRGYEILIERIGKGLNFFGISLIFLLALLIVAQIIARAGFRESIPGSLEVPQLMGLVAVFSAMAYTLARGGHVKVEVLAKRFSPRAQAIVASIFDFLGLAALAVIVYGGVDAVVNSTSITTYDLRIPIYPFRGFIALAILVMWLTLLCNFVLDIRHACGR